MEKLIFIILLLTLKFSYSQENAKCEKIVALTIDAINNHSSKTIEEFLAEDFTIAGQKGKTAIIVLEQLFNQLDQKVLTFKKSKESNENNLVLEYEITYSKLGKKTGTFIFDKNNKLKELNLFKMEVKSTGNTDVKNNISNFISVPFKRNGDLILVEGLINGEKRNFILDNGAPKLILNKRYFTKTDDTAEKHTISNVLGAGGSVSDIDITNIQSFEFYGISITGQNVISVDLKHIEDELKIEIYGLIGYEVIKDYDLLFDYDQNNITLIKPEYSNQFILDNFKKSKQKVALIEMNAHIATIKGKIGKDFFQFGIDCGASINIITEKYLKSLSKSVRNLEQDTIIGADKNVKIEKVGILKNLAFNQIKFKNLRTSFSNFDHLNNAYKVKLDGLIGFEVLSKQKTLLSYKNKKLIFID